MLDDQRGTCRYICTTSIQQPVILIDQFFNTGSTPSGKVETAVANRSCNPYINCAWNPSINKSNINKSNHQLTIIYPTNHQFHQHEQLDKHGQATSIFSGRKALSAM